jgi:hypothetical protein
MVYVRLDISETRRPSDVTDDELRESIEQASAAASYVGPQAMLARKWFLTSPLSIAAGPLGRPPGPPQRCGTVAVM